MRKLPERPVLTYLMQAAQRLKPGTIQLGLRDTFPEHEGALMQTIAERWMKQAAKQAAKQAEKQGLEQGAQQQAAEIALRLLRRRLGLLDARLQSRIRILPTGTLSDLTEAALDITTKKDLLEWLAKHDAK